MFRIYKQDEELQVQQREFQIRNRECTFDYEGKRLKPFQHEETHSSMIYLSHSACNLGGPPMLHMAQRPLTDKLLLTESFF